MSEEVMPYQASAVGKLAPIAMAGGDAVEHRQVALAAQRIFVDNLPVIAAALGWTEAVQPNTYAA